PDGGKLVLLCRSGVRSIAAAKRATELGLEAYNILEGFEGDPDAHAHRGNKGGWRMRGLPWRQG
ncbi:MAG TPA: MBL fold metallo-hydrolase, partial [Rhodoferax sp.]|nr:MBL fold metallo-hydrolase [Rhodoferax sp.]